MQSRILPLLLIIFLLEGCSKVNKVGDFLTNPTAREIYKRDLKINAELFSIWETENEKSLENDSAFIELPYRESGKFFPKSFPVFSYLLELHRGDLLSVKIEQDSTTSLTFIDVFYISNTTYKKIKSSKFDRAILKLEIEEDNLYRVVIQPEIEASSYFNIEIKRSPLYLFPVASGKNSDAQSFWGAERDGGKRSHEGIDIFAKRGTPVIASVDGRITSSGEKGLGGKQVWLRDTKRGYSLYYAHLDSISTIKKYQVKAGDTLGFVGNTGNARSTAPHLHFGIYSGYSGAINPYYFIKKNDFKFPEKSSFFPKNQLAIIKNNANLRNSNSVKKSKIIRRLSAGDTIHILGQTEDWFHIKDSNLNNSFFLHSSLAAPIY